MCVKNLPSAGLIAESSVQLCLSFSPLLPPCDGDCGNAQTTAVSDIKHTFQQECNHVSVPAGTLDCKSTRVFSALEESIVLLLNV